MKADMSLPSRSGGATLIEFMIASVLGLVIMASLAIIFATSSRSRAELEKSNQMISNGRSALELMNEDLRMAGYMAEFDTSVLTDPSALPSGAQICPSGTGVVDLDDLKDAMMLHVQGIDNVSGTGYPCLSDVRAGTDIILVRRASSCTTAEATCQTGPFVQASLCSEPAAGAANMELSFSPSTNADYAAHYFLVDASIASMTLHKRDCTTHNDVYQYQVHIYFVANNHETGDGIPTLKRAELRDTGFTIVPLVEGVENMQIEYGLDTGTPTTGVASAWTSDPTAYTATSGVAPTAAEIVTHWRSVVEAKLHLLVRNTQTSAGYVDNHAYTLAGVPASAPGDAYKRHVYSTSVRFASPSWRRSP